MPAMASISSAFRPSPRRASRRTQADLAGERGAGDDDIALFADRVRARLGDDARAEAGCWSRAICPSARHRLRALSTADAGRRHRRRGGSDGLPADAPRTAAPAVPPSRADRGPGDRSAGRAAAQFPLAARPAPGRARRRSGAHRAGMVARQARQPRPATISASRMRTAAATGSTAKAFTARRRDRRAGSCTGSSHERACPALCRVRASSRISRSCAAPRSRRSWWSPPSCSALPAIGLADRNTVAGVVRAWQQAEGGQASPIIPAAAWSFATARPTCSPIRRTARAGGICAAC